MAERRGPRLQFGAGNRGCDRCGGRRFVRGRKRQRGVGCLNRDRETVRSGRAAAASTHELLGALRDFLLSLVTLKGTAVLIIDEAQQLSPRVLEQIHVLSNLETSEAKLLQIVLVGQLNLLDVLAQADMRQINQRVSLRAMLTPLNREEVEAYIGHRLGVAQGSTDTSFQPDALELVHRYSGGMPRIINLICDRALMGGAAVREPAISASHVRHAAQDLGLPPLPSAPPGRFLTTPRWAAVLLIGVLALAGAIGAVLVTHPLDTWVQTVPPAPSVAPLPITAPPALAGEHTEVEQRLAQQLVERQKWIEHQRRESVRVELLDQRAADRRLAGADVAGEDDDA